MTRPDGMDIDEHESSESKTAVDDNESGITDASHLSSDQIVKLLIDEFGSLTVDEHDTEQLIWEMDGAYLQEIAILGIVHLTSHRLAFHASLLSTRPDLLPEKQIIRRGPVTIHRRGLRRKRRVWLELSHDMLTCFPSSKEEDRMRPLWSCLLSSIKMVYPEDEGNKKTLRFEFGVDKMCSTNSHAEFDTEESAREWRRELQGAIYMNRHGRVDFLSRRSEDETRGVQISIPLSRVKSFSTRMALKYANMVNMELSSGRGQTSISESDMEGRTIEIGVARQTHSWDDFGKRVEAARGRERRAGVRIPPKVIVDFGALSFLERNQDVRKVEDSKEEAIRNALGLGVETEIWYTRASIARSIASTGYLAISKHYVGYWTKCLSIKDAKYRFPISKIAGARPNYRYVPRVFGLILDLREHPSMYFDFYSEERRDEAIRRITDAVEAHRSPASIGSPVRNNSTSTSSGTGTSATTASMPVPVPTVSHVLSPLSRTIDRATSKRFAMTDIPLLPKVINLPAGTLPRASSMHFVCLTIGSRGDVQPYIALGRTLLQEGHSVSIVTHAEYKEWVEGWGIRHRTAGGDPGALMKLSVEHKMFSPQFFKESLGNFRTWLDDLLADAWEQCKDADVLLESPSAMAGVHIAEALNIPYFRTFTMPWTKTTEFPHPFLSPPVELAHFNASTYILFDNVFWSATAGQINRWRRNTLHIGNTDMGHLAQSKIPFIYNFSPSVVPKPLDWGDAITVSGYWFLDNPDLNWSPPSNLLQWMEKAREDEKPIVYIGFGSITVPNPPAMTRSIVKAVKKSGVRAIISKGWSARMSKSDEPEFEFPPECYSIDKIPHDWLFPQIDAALHHGGAGTTGASLRAGIPTLVKPWFGDQFFWASRVQKIGAGLRVSSLHSSELANALVRATTDRVMKERAAAVGENIRQESGVQNALHAIYTYLDRAGRVRTTLD
ncbi:UDP-Glycosyltransferase/glycogen phosphorylase [Fomitiporia mediterranea MF3/22]|uniref:UDP-Glycosyltransferase/glycogen phosphorylase n=1 Tax=Fomitiporia mediterranea (strain MF3/22) TaxID=694068 RepID=UPI0004409349|nr:UDP-Glycosyltransferase/glycogen phosphorylase [Fomitiporia mediterranea MF3/22]EJC98880.1 UDP-Glycosyltransferase/glycogen phosphorylase [Fomitiporia mediterranea MF3/22]